jgi:hypothetical protein
MNPGEDATDMFGLIRSICFPKHIEVTASIYER